MPKGGKKGAGVKVGVEVEGLDAFKKDLRKVDKDLGKRLKAAHNVLADEVLADANAKGSSLGGVAAKAVGAGALKSTSTLKGAAITILGKAVPYSLGAEFGSIQYGQFDPWTGNQWTTEPVDIGYFLNPAIYEAVRNGDLLEMYHRELLKLERFAWPD